MRSLPIGKHRIEKGGKMRVMQPHSINNRRRQVTIKTLGAWKLASAACNNPDLDHQLAVLRPAGEASCSIFWSLRYRP